MTAEQVGKIGTYKKVSAATGEHAGEVVVGDVVAERVGKIGTYKKVSATGEHEVVVGEVVAEWVGKIRVKCRRLANMSETCSPNTSAMMSERALSAMSSDCPSRPP